MTGYEKSQDYGGPPPTKRELILPLVLVGCAAIYYWFGEAIVELVQRGLS